MCLYILGYCTNMRHMLHWWAPVTIAPIGHKNKNINNLYEERCTKISNTWPNRKKNWPRWKSVEFQRKVWEGVNG